MLIKMPRVHVSQFDVISGLKELSDEADRALPQLDFQTGVFAKYFDSIRSTFIKIRDAETVEEVRNVEYPPCPRVFNEEENTNVNSEAPQKLRENVHGKVSAPGCENVSKGAECQGQVDKCNNSAADKSDESRTVVQSISPTKKVLKKSENPQATDAGCDNSAADYKNRSNESRTVTQSNSSVNILAEKEMAECQVRVVVSDEIDANQKKNKSDESCGVNQFNTPVELNNAVVKLERIDVSKLDVTYNMCTPENDKPESQNLYQTPALNQTFNKVINKTLILDSGFSGSANGSKSKKVNNNDSGIVTRSASKQNNTPGGKSLRKRKSSSSTDDNRKQPRREIAAAAASKTTQSKYPLRKVPSKNAVTKVQAVVQPVGRPKQPEISKEQKLLQQLKEKEEKVNRNIERVQAERQQKAEQQKKNRELKTKSVIEKKLQLEKENPKKTRIMEVVEQHLKENKLSGLSASKQSDNINNDVLKTPSDKIVDDDENCYELTPLPNSSTYNFSDDEEEEEKTKGKRIPLWAQGVLLKQALVQQYYNPVDTDKLFGRVIDPPNLALMFQVSKKRYLKRTSSAIWNSPPLATN